MPSHSFLRIGRYHDAVRSGTAAHDSDQRYEQHGAVAYGPAHDLVVLVYSAGLSGEKPVALANTDALRDHYEAHPGKLDGHHRGSDDVRRERQVLLVVNTCNYRGE